MKEVREGIIGEATGVEGGERIAQVQTVEGCITALH